MNVSDSARGVRLLALTAVVSARWGRSRRCPAGVRAQTPAVKFDVRAAKGLRGLPGLRGLVRGGREKSTPCSGTTTATSRKSSTFPSVPTTSVAPGPPDQGQPTRFLPGLHYGVFAVALPNDPADDRADLDPHGQRADAVDSCVSGRALSSSRRSARVAAPIPATPRPS